MGLFSGLFGKKDEKSELIKSLVKRRISEDPFAEAEGYTESMVDKLSKSQLMGTPEAAIVSIIETYESMQKIGASAHDILTHIESHRSQLGAEPESMPDPLLLEPYIHYRVYIENMSGTYITETMISAAIENTKSHYKV